MISGAAGEMTGTGMDLSGAFSQRIEHKRSGRSRINLNFGNLDMKHEKSRELLTDQLTQQKWFDIADVGSGIAVDIFNGLLSMWGQEATKDIAIAKIGSENKKIDADLTLGVKREDTKQEGMRIQANMHKRQTELEKDLAVIDSRTKVKLRNIDKSERLEMTRTLAVRNDFSLSKYPNYGNPTYLLSEIMNG